jgi:hypothetical protein
MLARYDRQRVADADLDVVALAQPEERRGAVSRSASLRDRGGGPRGASRNRGGDRDAVPVESARVTATITASWRSTTGRHVMPVWR